MGGGCDCRAVETRPAQNLFPMNAPERYKQDRVLTAERERKTTREKQSVVMRRERQKRKNKTERKKNM